jgi:hypothetical protein
VSSYLFPFFLHKHFLFCLLFFSFPKLYILFLAAIGEPVALDNIIDSFAEASFLKINRGKRAVELRSLNDKLGDMTTPKNLTPEPVWLFEDLSKEGGWIPFDLKTQEILEYAYQNYGELFNSIKKRTCSNSDLHIQSSDSHTQFVDNLLERNSIKYELVHEHIKVIVQDSHFDEPISLFPISFLACLQDADLLLDRRGTGHPDDYISTFAMF